MNASRFFFERDRMPEQIRRNPRPFVFEAFACRLYVGIPLTLYVLSSDCRTRVRMRALPCLTSKMSHDRSRRAACFVRTTIRFLLFDFHIVSTRRDGCGRWLWRLVGPFAHPEDRRILGTIQATSNAKSTQDSAMGNGDLNFTARQTSQSGSFAFQLPYR
jgi:hypothetical protein